MTDDPKVTLTTASAGLFETGDWIVIGSWPRWMYKLHIPEKVRRWIQWTCAKFGKRFGPSKPMQITAARNNEITL